MGQLDEALKHYEIAVKKDPSNGNYYYNRALVKAKLEKLDNKSIEYLSDQNYIYQARFNKGICLRRLGRLD
jgi:tetratricopeptide (TPR) repeat protein